MNKAQHRPGNPEACAFEDNDDADDDADEELTFMADYPLSPADLGPGYHPISEVDFSFQAPPGLVGVDPGNGAPFTFWEEGLSKKIHVTALFLCPFHLSS